MDFTREPIIETVITPKEGCKLVVRSSKTIGQEEYFVDAVEVVTFGNAIFFRSLERPKSFIVPASDYEVLEVREARIVLKNVGMDRSIKIGGGRDNRIQKDTAEEVQTEKESVLPLDVPRGDNRSERKRDRRRQYRKKRSREEAAPVFAEETQDAAKVGLEESVDLPMPQKMMSDSEAAEAVSMSGSLLSSLLTPPPTLIADTIGIYKEKFRDAFYTKEEQEAQLASEELPSSALPDLTLPSYGSFEMSEEEEEEIYRQRKRRIFLEEEDAEQEEEKNESGQDEAHKFFPANSDDDLSVSQESENKHQGVPSEIIPLPPKEE